ncbi:protein ALP1-like [Rana temporaria]|uniref:protein ALP1-like n=1 Tax=Rana temporaria TaxID=8407 RepID=UPI001AAD3431|nr:protein ALP1-like [Rana temporaria]
MSDDEMACMLAAATATSYMLYQGQRRRKRARRYWIHPVIAGREETGQFWVLYNDLREHEEKFLDYTRMSIKSFDELLELLSGRLQRMDTFFRNSIPPVERLIITLRYLSTGQSLGSLHYAFRIGKSTASYIIRDTCSAIWEVLHEVVFKKPTAQEWAQIAEVFWQRCNFPNCVGAIDGKHIRIVKPMTSGSEFFNYKKYFSFVLMAVADANYCFTYIDIGSYGSSADSTIFGNSSFGQMLRTDGLDLPECSPLPGTNGPLLPSVFVGDEAFSLGTNLLRPYSGHSLTQERSVFNYRLTRARRVVECAFGILANKWRLLHTPIVLNMQNAVTAVKAACALHNFVRQRDGFDFEEPVAETLERAQWTGVRGNRQGSYVRDQYAAYFMSPAGQVPWQLDSI